MKLSSYSSSKLYWLHRLLLQTKKHTKGKAVWSLDINKHHMKRSDACVLILVLHSVWERLYMFILARDRKFLDKSRLLTRDCQRRIMLVKISWLLTNFLPRVFYLLEATPRLYYELSTIPGKSPGESLTFPHGPTDTWFHFQSRESHRKLPLLHGHFFVSCLL